MRLSLPLLSRRLLLHSLVSLAPLLTPTSLPKHCLAAPLPPTSTPQSPSAPLLALIPLLPYGAPATRATLPLELADAIEAEAASLERFHPTRNAATDPRLNGSWRLRYTNAPEITSLAKGLPLGFTLGKTYQPVDTSLGFFENQATIEHALRLARASTRVVGELRVAPGGTRNAAGVEDTEGNRVDVDFQRITFSVDELFGQPVSGLRKIVIPKNTPTAAQPSNDVTYLDGTMRMTRGGDGSLFVLTREENERPLLSTAERRALFTEIGSDVATGKAAVNGASPPEYRKLFEELRNVQP